jgi:hypothetical protein
MFGASKVIFTRRQQVITVTEGSRNPIGAIWFYGYEAPEGTGSVNTDTTLTGHTIIRLGYNDSTLTTGGILDYPRIDFEGDLSSLDPAEVFSTAVYEGDSNVYTAQSRSGWDYNASLNYTIIWWENNEHPARWDGSGTSTVTLTY